MSTLPHPSDGLPRCRWCLSAPEFLAYHDQEWGFPVVDEVRLFEKLCLEGFQSGLSWRTIYAKRERFRAVFAGFDPHRVARFDADDVARLLADPGIVRHRGKIEAVIHNAGRALDLVAEAGSLAAFVWSFEPATPPTWGASTSPASHALSKALKQRGWKFVGPTTVHAFLQAMGLINDHHPECVVHAKAQTARAVLVRPGRD